MTIDLAAILKIVGVDIMLGVDNAIVIALACAQLPAKLRNRAVWLGTVGAIVLRSLLLICAGALMGLAYVKLAAGAYLLYLGYRLLTDSDGEPSVSSPDRILAAVKTIVVADFMMSLDNVLAVVGAAQSAGEHSTAYAVAGIVLSIPVIVFGAQVIMKLMDRYQIIAWLGAGLLGWVGAEMMITDPVMAGYIGRVNQSFGEDAGLAYKLAGFCAVVMAAIAADKLSRREDKTINSAWSTQ